ncbi:MAG: tetraacyldisaccharide 4'-kinase [Rickettsiales bacterium]|jgi:tetraacyldisaccharide 4'-kinase|nr:tetraacyldisaccharide 4'-kinase [Rickettsiales bacterium]
MNTPSWFLKKNIISWLLWPFSILYICGHLAVYIFRLFHQKTSKRPVICIGGILAGGVGKTPVVYEIARRFGAVIVMRGYKGIKDRGKTESKLVKTSDSANNVGDEAKMLANHGLRVYVGPDRWESIKLAENQGSHTPGPHPIVFDDGFQNPSVKKDVSILVFDGKIGVGNGFCLPAGPLREPLYMGLNRADAVIIIKNDDDSQFAIHNSQIPVFLAKNELVNPGLHGKVVAFAGIGYPRKFFDSVAKMPNVSIVKSIPFPDHYDYKKQDIADLFKCAEKHGAQLCCTEKDWVKLPEIFRNKIKYVPLRTTIQPEFWEWLDSRIAQIGEKSAVNNK